MPVRESGFFNLGNAVAGGDINRQDSYLEGLDTGSRINARRASTTNALAQARLRIDEYDAKQGLANAIEGMGGPKELAVQIRAGGNPEQLIAAMLGQQEIGFRDTIADATLPLDQRQASAQAVEGKVVDPLQFGPGGELFADVFQGGAPQVTPTGQAQIGADEALAQDRIASAKLDDEKRLYPDRFKASTKTGVDGTTSIVDDLLGPNGGGVSIVPEGFDPGKAFGAQSVVQGAINNISDFIGIGNVFDDQAQAEAFMGEIAARIQIILRADVPGGRPPVIVQELLGRYAEDPSQLFRGDDQALVNLTTTRNSLARSLARVKTMLDSGVKMTPTKSGNLMDQMFAFSDTVADLDNIIAIMNKQKFGDNFVPEQKDNEGWITTESGLRYRVKE